MRLLRNLLSNFTRSAPKRDFAHVHDIQIKWERVPNSKNDNKEAGSMSLNGMYSSLVLQEQEEWMERASELVSGFFDLNG
jgi:hypothetical protein